MIYDITKPTAPAMPTLGKGTECIKILLSQASKDMQEPLVPMFFPILGAHVSGAEFQYPDHTWKELCGIMANLVAESGGNKGQLSRLVDALCRDFRAHDDAEMRKRSHPLTLKSHSTTLKNYSTTLKTYPTTLFPYLLMNNSPELYNSFSSLFKMGNRREKGL